jgi:hypothetical protein
MTTPDAPLSPSWAFVVQLREGTALTLERLQGASNTLCRVRRPRSSRSPPR